MSVSYTSKGKLKCPGKVGQLTVKVPTNKFWKHQIIKQKDNFLSIIAIQVATFRFRQKAWSHPCNRDGTNVSEDVWCRGHHRWELPPHQERNTDHHWTCKWFVNSCCHWPWLWFANCSHCFDHVFWSCFKFYLDKSLRPWQIGILLSVNSSLTNLGTYSQ